MKKILLPVFSICLVSLAHSQQENGIPASVTILGGSSGSEYNQLVSHITLVEDQIFKASQTFSSVNEMSVYSNNILNNGEPDDEEVLFSKEALDILVQNNGDYSAILAGLSFSEEFRSIASAVMKQVYSMKDGTDVDEVLYPIASTLNETALTTEEKDKLRVFIIALNANFKAIINSKYFAKLKKTEGITVEGRSFWGTVWSAIQCALGTVGSAVLGGIGGAGVGTVTLPVIGTVSGAATGFWGGAIVGIATFC